MQDGEYIVINSNTKSSSEARVPSKRNAKTAHQVQVSIVPASQPRALPTVVQHHAGFKCFVEVTPVMK